MEGEKKNIKNNKNKNNYISTTTSASTSFLLTLTVITGQNIANRKIIENSRTLDLEIPDYIGSTYSERTIDSMDSSDSDDIPNTTSKAYTLTKEVQRVLIEDFFPPISSSTIPGNPGRLFITLTGDNNEFNN